MISTNKDDFHKKCITKPGKNTVRQETIGLLGSNSSENGALVSFQNGQLRKKRRRGSWRPWGECSPQKSPLKALVQPGLDRPLARIWAAISRDNPLPGTRETAKLPRGHPWPISAASSFPVTLQEHPDEERRSHSVRPASSL